MPETVTQRKMAQLPPETCQLKAADDQTSGPGRLCLQWPPDLLHFKFGGTFVGACRLSSLRVPKTKAQIFCPRPINIKHENMHIIEWCVCAQTNPYQALDL